MRVLILALFFVSVTNSLAFGLQDQNQKLETLTKIVSILKLYSKIDSTSNKVSSSTSSMVSSIFTNSIVCHYENPNEKKDLICKVAFSKSITNNSVGDTVVIRGEDAIQLSSQIWKLKMVNLYNFGCFINENNEIIDCSASKSLLFY